MKSATRDKTIGNTINKIMLGFILGYYILEKEWIENACN